MIFQENCLLIKNHSLVCLLGATRSVSPRLCVCHHTHHMQPAFQGKTTFLREFIGNCKAFVDFVPASIFWLHKYQHDATDELEQVDGVEFVRWDDERNKKECLADYLEERLTELASPCICLLDDLQLVTRTSLCSQSLPSVFFFRIWSRIRPT